ncbi:MAG: tRNA (adenosine(37)-N6)-threonylcarbamoyltransferase complex ATPase subunit type 1 TsaE [Microthrixaceae bacterium]
MKPAPRHTSPAVRAVTTSADDTRALAAALAELARPGDLLLLSGDLGAGKTAFCQGFGRGLGVTDHITSPTFALVQSYEGRLPMHHLDVYRLEQVAEALDLGLSELLDEGAVTVIEWGDAIAPVLGHEFLEVHLVHADDPSEPDRRTIELVTVGTRWQARVRALVTVLGPWAPPEDPSADAAPTGQGGA